MSCKPVLWFNNMYILFHSTLKSLKYMWMNQLVIKHFFSITRPNYEVCIYISMKFIIERTYNFIIPLWHAKPVWINGHNNLLQYSQVSRQCSCEVNLCVMGQPSLMGGVPNSATSVCLYQKKILVYQGTV